VNGINKRIFLWLMLLCAVPGLAQAASYSYTPETYSWINPATHANVTWTNAASCTGGGAAVDDDITGLINLGFTFKFGATNYTQVRVMSNGRLQFNNTFCGYGTQVTGPPRTYPYGYPNANVVRTMKVYGADFDPAQGGTVRYASLGTAPNRYFVVTWSSVPEWNTTAWTCAQSCFNLQVIIHENGEFVYQYGSSLNPSNGKADIGWELTTTDYGLYSFTSIGALANTAVRFYPTPVAEYQMDETTWVGASSVIDSSGNAKHGTPLGTAQTVAGGKLCRGGNIPSNNSAATIDAINTGLDVDTQIGSTGAISFWYKSTGAWDGGGSSDAQLFDATTVNNRWFYLVRQQGNGRLFFTVTDNANNLFQVQTANNNIAANTWTHIVVTWKFTTVAADNRMQIYLNGVLTQSTAIGTTSPLSASIGTLYLGDNRSSFVTNPGTGNSANGVIDEVRIYNHEASSTVIQRDYTATRACPAAVDHYRLEHTGSGLTCTPSTVTVKACADAACSTLYSGSASVTLSPGSGWATNPITFTGSTTVDLSVTTPSTVTLGTTAASPTPSGTSPQCFVGATANCSLVFADTGFLFSTIPTQTAGVTSGSLTIQAVKKADNSTACAGVFTGNVVVNMASQCINPTTCNGKQVTINTTAITNNPAVGVPSYSPVTLNFGASSTATFTLNYPDVGNMSLSARYALGSDFMTGTSNTFVVKPFGFTVTGIKRTSDNFANPGAGSAAGPVFIKAGDAFTATVTATAQGGAAAPNYGREITPEGVLLTPNILLPATGNNPAFTNGTIAGGSFASGVATPANLAWGEVGIITLTPSVADADYLGAGDTTGTTTGNAGRFYAHHFAATATLATRADLVCVPVSSFTYMGEPMGLALSFTAQNAGNSTTLNYTTASGFAKLDGATVAKWTTFGGADSIGLGAVDGTNALSARLAISGAPSGNWAAGVGSLSANVLLNRAGGVDGPFEILKLGIAPQDADSVTLLPGALNLDADLNASLERMQVPAAATAKVRYGRIRLNNAHGSELLALPVPLRAQYYNGSGFVTHGDDNCTAFTLAPTVNNIPTNYQYGDLLLSNPQPSSMLASVTTTAPTLTSPISAGISVITLAKPNPTLSGSVDLTLNVPAWLEYNWTGVVGDPKSRATFGLHRKADQFIYQRENY